MTQYEISDSVRILEIRFLQVDPGRYHYNLVGSIDYTVHGYHYTHKTIGTDTGSILHELLVTLTRIDVFRWLLPIPQIDVLYSQTQHYQLAKSVLCNNKRREEQTWHDQDLHRRDAF